MYDLGTIDPSPPIRVPWLRSITAALVGTAAGAAFWFLLKAYTDAFRHGVLPTVLAALILIGSGALPVFYFAGKELRRGTYAQVLPVNALLSFLGLTVVLGGESLAWWIAHKAVVWDIWLGGMVVAAAVLPLALGPYLWDHLAQSIEQFKKSLSRLAVGRVGGWPLVSAAILVVITVSALVSFQAIFRPEVKDLAAKIPVDWFGNLLLAGVCFSIVNAALEELVFRGILWEVVSDEWNKGTALGVTSLLFGVGHFYGYPPGPIGAVMAGLYGITLGGLRWWTGGLALAFACHISADATIFCILAMEEVFDGF
jgi:membrane protease YdiL (CAAX protease family)